MKLTLGEMKLYLRVDENDEDNLIESLLEFSVEEIENSTGANIETYGELETYKLLQKIIVTDRYENRGSSDMEFTPNNICTSLYMKLKLQVDIDDEDTSK